MAKHSLFTTSKPVVGVVHLLPLPGSPGFGGDLDLIREKAWGEVQALRQGGVDGIIIENFHDFPFCKLEITREQLSLMASIISSARKEVNIPLGVNVHFNDWKSEIALAYSCNAQFVRIEVFVDTVVTASGIVEPCCAEATRYRKLLGGEHLIEIWADVHPKYSRNLLPTSLQASAKMASDALADAIIVTGETTGVETPYADLQEVKDAVNLPVFAGSGTNIENVSKTLAIADGVIVGSAFKDGKSAGNGVLLANVLEFMEVVRRNDR